MEQAGHPHGCNCWAHWVGEELGEPHLWGPSQPLIQSSRSHWVPTTIPPVWSRRESRREISLRSSHFETQTEQSSCATKSWGSPHPSFPNPGAISPASHRQSHAPAPQPAETTAPTPCTLHPLAVARQTLRLGPCPVDSVQARLWPRVNKQPFLQGCCLLPPQPPSAGLAVPAARLRGLARSTPVVAVGSAAGARACHHGWRRAGLKQQTNKKHAQLG